jgi:hypothetical protein
MNTSYAYVVGHMEQSDPDSPLALDKDDKAKDGETFGGYTAPDNHGTAGANVLYVGGQVVWYSAPRSGTRGLWTGLNLPDRVTGYWPRVIKWDRWQ